MMEIYSKRPFKTRNAEEFDLTQILDLFVSPSEGLSTPFEFENTIVKGRMGSGKTMYLRANYSYYLYTLVPSLLAKEDPVLPVMIRLSDFQHITNPNHIYNSIILRIIEELCSIYSHLQNAKKLAKIHDGFRNIPSNLHADHKIETELLKLKALNSDEYVEKLSSDFGLAGGIKPKFFELSANYKKGKLTEIKSRPSPGIKDIEDCYRSLLEHENGKVLLLIDEAGALDKSFFRSESGGSLFEVLMNQFRTAPFIRTKIAIYPNSYSDILTETRYGDNVLLEENIIDEAGYKKFRFKVFDLIYRYINQNIHNNIKQNDIFETSTTSVYGDSIEQIIHASNGNIRRLIKILDASMESAYSEHGGNEKVSLKNVTEALIRQSHGLESLYTLPEREFLQEIAEICKNRSTYRFKFPYMSPVLNKYISRSQEYNLINIIELGSGRRSNTYAFDYTYCVAHDIPSHYVGETEKINKERSLIAGPWITRVAQISEFLLAQAGVPGKIEGQISFVQERKGFIQGDDGKEYFFFPDHFVEEDQKSVVMIGNRVRFSPAIEADQHSAVLIEIL